MKTILITGGAGFIGSNLCHHLIEDNNIICMDNLSCGSFQHISDLIGHPNFSFIEKDVKQSFDIACDQIFHLAAHASPKVYMSDPIETAMTIGLGAINVLNNAEKYQATVLLASTSEIYGEPQVHPQPESYFGHVNTVGSRSCYDQSKRWMETLGNDYRLHRQVNVKIVRIFNTYGPRMNPKDGRVISEMIVRGINREQMFIYGDGSQTRSFCYIDDLIEQMIGVMESDCHGPINLGNDQEFSLIEIADLVSKHLEHPLKLTFVNALINDPLRRKPELTKLNELGYRAKIGIIEGLSKTVNYFASRYDRETYE
jgi:UDP-glucuronate decarboxylase